MAKGDRLRKALPMVKQPACEREEAAHALVGQAISDEGDDGPVARRLLQLKRKDSLEEARSGARFGRRQSSKSWKLPKNGDIWAML